MTSYSPKYKQAWLRPARLAIASLAAVITAGDHVGAANGRKERAAAFESRIAGEPVEPIMAIVSLRNQRITVFDAKGWVLRAPTAGGSSSSARAARPRTVRNRKSGPEKSESRGRARGSPAPRSGRAVPASFGGGARSIPRP